MAAWLFICSCPLLSYDLEKTFSKAPLSLTLYSQIHDSYHQRQSVALAEVFGGCDSDDGLDADNENWMCGCAVRHTLHKASLTLTPDMGSAPC